jgi:quercetin dioxygenase-like cupin family protein
MSIIHPFNGSEHHFSWKNVPIKKYAEEFEGVTKQVFIGPDDGSHDFVMRYFHLQPGTHSNLESHPHAHGVLILHGNAHVQLNNDIFQVKPFDAIYISGNDIHQFVVEGDEPLGFLCVIKKLDKKVK